MMQISNLHIDFGTKVPNGLLSFIEQILQHSRQNNIDPIEIFFDLFNINWFGGYNLRYFNTPFEFFPYAGNGSGGEHFGYVIHMENQKNFKTGYFDPINDDEIQFLGNNTSEMIQNLLTEEREFLGNYAALIKKLNLDTQTNPDRFDVKGSIEPFVPANWKWKRTEDGIGVLAPAELFNPIDISREQYKIIFYNRITEFMSIAVTNKEQGFYGTALYYLKNLYYYESSNFEYAIEIINEMIEIYEYLDRNHLCVVAKRTKKDLQTQIETIDNMG